MKSAHRIRHLRRKLETQLLDDEKLDGINAELARLNEELTKETNEKNYQEELDASRKIKEDPNAFFRYVNSFRKDKTTVGPLTNENGDLVSDPQQMADIFNLAFSKNFTPADDVDLKILEGEFKKDKGNENLSILLSQEDVLQSISEAKSNHSCGQDGISSYVVKHLKNILAPVLVAIYQRSLNQEENIEEVYTEDIVLVFKKGLKSICLNYRPIARTSVISRIFERILMTKIQNHFQKNGLECSSQYGFSKGKSLQMNLLRYKSYIMKNLKENPKSAVITLFIDYAKAFQKVSHSILLRKLQKLKVGGKIGLWIMRWLNQRRMCVTINESRSNFLPVTSGIPEGSVAGPQLFKVMLMNIPTSNDPHLLLLSFADDTHLGRLVRDKSDL